MAQPYIGEIRMVAFNFAPAGWAFCDGQLLPISENETLFQLIGTMYGGDGESTFALPNMQSRVPMHMGQGPGLANYQITEMAGTESVTLSTNQIPLHTHSVLAVQANGNDAIPSNRLLSMPAGADLYILDTPSVPLNPSVVTPVGGSQPHENMMPFLAIHFIISLFGIFPSPT